jgi:phosphate starvation-inducible membrane PsiE
MVYISEYLLLNCGEVCKRRSNESILYTYMYLELAAITTAYYETSAAFDLCRTCKREQIH